MLALIRRTFPEVLRAVAPLAAVACILQILLVRAPAAVFLQFVAGSTLAVIGMVFLFAGIDLGVLPMGRYIGAELPRRGSLPFILAIMFALGFATTVAEPDVIVLAGQVEAISGGEIGAAALVSIVGGGVGIFAALALLRIVYGFSMAALMMAVYGSMVVLSLIAPARVVPLAYDAGSVTTGVLTSPVVLALALGFNSVLGDRDTSDNFGILGLASVGPVLAILVAGLLL